MDYILTLLVLIMFGIILLKDAHMTENAETFMSVPFTNGLKGIACVLIVLVHIPVPYTNVITKVILHFGYIYTTIFFMISAYGCRYAVTHNSSYLKVFWRKRLKTLFVPAIIINLIDFVLGCLIHGEMQYYRLSAFNHYIYTILFVYLIFWICWKLDVIPVKYKDTAVIFLLVCASLMTMYTPIKVLFQWPVESIGFIWGLLIFHYKEEIKSIFLKYGMKIRVILGGFSFVFGVLYLRFKTVHFSGEYVLKVILGVLLLGFILSLCYRFSFKGRGITWLGNISYEIYLFHIVVINNLKDVLPECRSGLFIFFVMAGTLTGAALVHAAVQHVNRGIQKIKVANHKEE